MHNVTLASDAAAIPLLRPFWRRVASAWPHVQAPSARWITHDELDRHPDDDLLIIALFGSESPSPLKVADALAARRTPTLLLFDQSGPVPPLDSTGILAARITDEPDRIAQTLHVLACRQPVVGSMRDELHLATCSHGKLRGEIIRFHDEMNLAQAVQRELIPSTLPEVDGLSIGALYRPAGFVSGDIYDARRIGSDHLAFFLMDAVGHGVPAALLTMIVSQTLRQTQPPVCDQLLSPAEALGRLNRELLHASSETQRFVTGVYGTLDLRTCEATVALGGHPPVLHVRENDVVELDAGGPLLGVFGESEYDQQTVTLLPGESLVLYSDGLEVAFPAPGRVNLPTQQFLPHLHRLGHGGQSPLDARLASFESAVDSQTGSLHQADDMTILIVENDARWPEGPVALGKAG